VVVREIFESSQEKKREDNPKKKPTAVTRLKRTNFKEKGDEEGTSKQSK